MRFLVCAATLLLTFSVNAQSVTGKWKTIDDESGKARSVVEIYQKEDKYYGKIIKLFRGPDEDPDPVCNECDDHRKGEKIRACS